MVAGLCRVSLSGAIREGKWNVTVGRKPDLRRYAGARAYEWNRAERQKRLPDTNKSGSLFAFFVLRTDRYLA